MQSWLLDAASRIEGGDVNRQNFPFFGISCSAFGSLRLIQLESFRFTMVVYFRVTAWRMSKTDKPQDAADQEVFLRLLFQHERRLESFVFSLVADFAAAEDIVQETKIMLWQQFDRYDPQKDFGAWARSIAYYQVLSHRKKMMRSREQQFSSKFLEAVAQAQEELSPKAAAREESLKQCVDQLQRQQQQLLLQCYSGEQTIKAVAEQRGRSVNATYKLLEKIRRQLSRCIERRLRGEDG